VLKGRTHGWVMRDAELRLKEFKASSKRGPANASVSARISPQVRFFATTAMIVSLQVSAVDLTKWPYKFWRDFAPSNPSTLQNSLWIVVATIVGVSIPVFVVIVQFAGDAGKDISALPLTEVLRRRSRIDVAFLASGIAVLHCGADALWFHGQAVLILDFAFALVPLILILGITYLRLFKIIASRADLKEYAYALLEEKLVDAIDQSWVTAEANKRLISILSEYGVLYSPFNYAVHSPEWIYMART